MPRIAKERKRAAVSINQIDRPKNLGLECLAFMYRKKRREEAEKEGWRMDRSRAQDSKTCTKGPFHVYLRTRQFAGETALNDGATSVRRNKLCVQDKGRDARRQLCCRIGEKKRQGN